METILVLTDFSYTAFNAARYAVNLANQLHAARVLLYHSFDSESADIPPPFACEVDDPWIQTIERLNELKSSLELFADKKTKIDIKTNSELLDLAIQNISKERKVGMVIMGSTGNNKLKRLFIGSNTISISDSCKLPLLIIPPDTDFENIKRAVFACDFKSTTTIPVRTIKSFVQQLHSKLSILYFDNEAEGLNINFVKQQKALHKLVDSINPDFSYIHGEDIVEDIIDFSTNNSIQMIIVIYKKERFLQNIFHPGTTNQLAYYSHFPLLVLKPVKCHKEENLCARSPINQQWHHLNPMPDKSNRFEFIAWHHDHQEQCGCRELGFDKGQNAKGMSPALHHMAEV